MKKFLALFLAIIQIMLLAACGTAASQPTAAPEAPAAEEVETAAPAEEPGKPFEGQTLTITSFLAPGDGSPRGRALEQIVANFEAETGAKVEFSVIPWEQLDNQLILSVQADNAPDLSWVRYQNFERDLEADALLSIDEFVERDFTEEDKARFLMWEQAGYADGSKYCIPTSLFAMTFVGRKDILDAAGMEIPKTWDEFVEVAKAVNTAEVPAFLFEGSPAQQTQLDWLQPVIESRGGKILDENGKAVFDSAEGVETFQFLRDCIHTYGITLEKSATMTTNEVIDNFTAGNAAFIFLNSQRYQVQVEALGAEKLFMSTVPGVTAENPGPTVSLPWMLGIPKTAKNPELSWAFMKYFTSDEAQKIYLTEASELPCVNSLNDDPYMDTEFGQTVKWVLEYIEKYPTVAIAGTHYAELADIIATTLQEVITTDGDIQAILTKACEKYNSIVA